VGATSAQTHDGTIAAPKDVVAQFLALADAAALGPEDLRAKVVDGAYASAFLRGFRDLAPDGRAVAKVALGAMIRGRMTESVALTPQTRERLTSSLRRQDEEKPVSVEGVLKSINLRGSDPKITLVTPTGPRLFRIVSGEHDDTIGPKLNRRVRVMGRSKPFDDGDSEDWADDVVLLDD